MRNAQKGDRHNCDVFTFASNVRCFNAMVSVPFSADVKLRERSGFTLLELILALALSSIVLMAVGMAVQVQIRSYDSRRGILEESQLARSLLRIIADDIRRTVVDYEQDMSGVEKLLESAKQSVGGAGNGGAAGEGQGGESSGAPGEEGQNAGEGEAGEGEAGAGGSGAAGGSTASVAGGTSNTEDLASATTLPTTPGIYGNSTQLQIDISRLPRVDEYQQDFTSNPLGQLTDIPSDIKTVSYFVQTQDDASTAAEVDSLAMIDGAGGTSQGLIRRELDRAVTQWAMTNGSATAVTQGGDLLAPEVVGIQFQYSDGVQWLSEWDTEYQEALPLAIEVILMMQSIVENPNAEQPTAAELAAATIRSYRLIVHVPVGAPPALEEETSTEGAL